MTVNIYAETSNDSLSRTELELYTIINEHRVANGLSMVRLSADLTLTAGRHAEDTTQNIWAENVIVPEGANRLHSWSDAYYYDDARAPEVMWRAPERLGTDYTGNGYEISAGGYVTIEDALEAFLGSPPHAAVIVNGGIWNALEWNAMGVGIVQNGPAGNSGLGGNVYHVWFGSIADNSVPVIQSDSAGGPLRGTIFGDRIIGDDGADTINGGDGRDRITGGAGDDHLTGGDSVNDIRDDISGGTGADVIDGGYGNDMLAGNAGNDTIEGGHGVDTIAGGTGDDQISGGVWSDLLFGADGDDFINGGFGNDRVNGGNGADRFFHLGVRDHGRDWIQDYDYSDGDFLNIGLRSRPDQFQVNFANTAGAGNANIEEGFVIYRPTGEIIWALVDAGAQENIRMQIGEQVFDLV